MGAASDELSSSLGWLFSDATACPVSNSSKLNKLDSGGTV